MPFPDELARPVAVSDYDNTWPAAFRKLADQLEAALGPLARAIDHTGSTSVPGLAAKDCIDTQVLVDDIGEPTIVTKLEAIGLRLRPEPWNRVEQLNGIGWPKLVFAPPIGERATNVHVRQVGSATARRNLLFRDFLRANPDARQRWSEFKQRLAQTVTDIFDYGQIKCPANEMLFIAAEDWVTRTNWLPHPELSNKDATPPL